jgi:hypothetical protein
LIAPNYVECVALVAGSSTRLIPDPNAPGAALPVPDVEYVSCGHRYHVGPGEPADARTCACGTFSIGWCAECGAPVCGDHSGLFEDRRLCSEDGRQLLAGREAAARAARADMERQRADEQRREATRRAEAKIARDALPPVRYDDLVDFFAGTGTHGSAGDVNGRRLVPTDARTVARALAAAGRRPAQLLRKRSFGVNRYVTGWVFDETTSAGNESGQGGSTTVTLLTSRGVVVAMTHASWSIGGLSRLASQELDVAALRRLRIG